MFVICNNLENSKAKVDEVLEKKKELQDKSSKQS